MRGSAHMHGGCTCACHPLGAAAARVCGACTAQTTVPSYLLVSNPVAHEEPGRARRRLFLLFVK